MSFSHEDLVVSLLRSVLAPSLNWSNTGIVHATLRLIATIYPDLTPLEIGSLIDGLPTVRLNLMAERDLRSQLRALTRIAADRGLVRTLIYQSAMNPLSEAPDVYVSV